MAGHSIESLAQYFEDYPDKEEILGFIHRQVKSASPKTKKLAKEFLKKNANDL